MDGHAGYGALMDEQRVHRIRVAKSQVVRDADGFHIEVDTTDLEPGLYRFQMPVPDEDAAAQALEDDRAKLWP